MVALELHGVGVAFVAHAPVLSDVHLHLGPGFTALVGANGAGKTTLLRVLAGELAPTEGAVRREPRDALVALVAQDAAAVSPDIEALADDLGGRAAALRGRLALEPRALARWSTLSSGERKRWQIGAALAREPDVLLLDEPTNHLDAEGRRLLVAALGRFRGTGVLVSHDRALLDELPTRTVRLHAGRAKAYAGGYSVAREAWLGERRAREDARAEAHANERALAAKLDAARREHEAAARGQSSRARMKGVRDHDARSAGAKTLAGYAEARAGRQVAALRSAHARAASAVPSLERDRTLGSAVFARWERAPSPVLFRLDERAVRAEAEPGRTLLRDVRLTLGREDRVRIAGPNGAGKTTLLRALLRVGPPRERVLHVPQELEEAEVRALLEGLRAAPSHTRGQVLSLFAALGSDPERVLARATPSALSPGEARKLALALGLGRHAWALVLDEPTNHMDLPSIERLERALDLYPGCLVLVTHDDAFAAACTRRVVRVEAGAVM